MLENFVAFCGGCILAVCVISITQLYILPHEKHILYQEGYNACKQESSVSAQSSTDIPFRRNIIYD